mmetsp:Transcript_4307/g.10386  ORF Transcript_4307/g.10386 Transcript_4307/m.10386 type:complete len:364 (+) Transcript_4307:137-1228(+)
MVLDELAAFTAGSEDALRLAIPRSWQGITAYTLLFLLKFSMASSVNTKQILRRFEASSALLLGIACQFILLPIIGLIVVVAFQVPPVVGISIIVVTSCPGGTWSNWFVALFNGDLPLSVAMTAVSTIIGVFALPINVMLLVHLVYDADVVGLHMWKAMIFAVCLVVLAISLGLLLSKCLNDREMRNRSMYCGHVIGVVLLGFMLYLSSTQDPLWYKPMIFFAAVCTPCIAGVILVHLFSITLAPGLSPVEVTTIVIEACYQNAGLAAAVLTTMFEGRDQGTVNGVCFVYAIAQGLVICCYGTLAWKLGQTYANPNDPIWEVLVQNHNEKPPKWRGMTPRENFMFDVEGDYGTGPSNPRRPGTS